MNKQQYSEHIQKAHLELFSSIVNKVGIINDKQTYQEMFEKIFFNYTDIIHRGIAKSIVEEFTSLSPKEFISNFHQEGNDSNPPAEFFATKAGIHWFLKSSEEFMKNTIKEVKKVVQESNDLEHITHILRTNLKTQIEFVNIMEQNGLPQTEIEYSANIVSSAFRELLDVKKEKIKYDYEANNVKILPLALADVFFEQFKQNAETSKNKFYIIINERIKKDFKQFRENNKNQNDTTQSVTKNIEEIRNKTSDSEVSKRIENKI